MVLTCMKMYAEAYLELKRFILDVLPVSKYASDICFTVEKVYRISVCHFGSRNPGYSHVLNFLRF